ncbi:hypothetical protein BKG82_18900 [Mycobacteroides chelonae]|uniref:Uncharacterized protein n=1 Tax=Mycobacteroides chelonae TaxID=1774 RepID=A0A1S1LKW4_MYCCH|nr:hypothetical protein [Mycobacteroides chelonae]OHU52334.1 hypothetical protein BKG82_18900 [Mycobacteroides chelonae]
MPGPDFAEEIAELTNARKQLVLERQQFADQLADQCVPRVNEWAKDVFLSQAKVADRMSANDIRALREEISLGAHEIAAHIRSLPRASHWPMDALQRLLASRVSWSQSDDEYAISMMQHDVNEGAKSHFDNINRAMADAGLTPGTAPDGRIIWGTHDVRPILAAARNVALKEQVLEEARAAFTTQTLADRWEAAEPA